MRISLLMKAKPPFHRLNWQKPSTYKHPMDSTLWALLLNPKSMTTYLKRRCSAFRVECVAQTRQIQRIPFHGKRRFVINREVILFDGQTPLMIAQTWLPHAALTGAARRLREMDDKPLGPYLFNTLGLVRHGFQVARWEETPQTIHWCRRSEFVGLPQPVVLHECFLPSLFELRQKSET